MYCPVVELGKEPDAEPLKTAWFEPAFMGDYSENLPLSRNALMLTGAFYDRAVAREPENMVFHQARALAYMDATLKAECFSALIDWLWVLRETKKDVSVIQNIVEEMGAFLPPHELDVLKRCIIDTSILLPLATGTVIAKGFSVRGAVLDTQGNA